MTEEVRIKMLEGQVRNLRRITYVSGLILAAGLVLAATGVQRVPDVMQAKKFEVINANGQVVVQMASNATGGGVVSTWNTKDIRAVMDTGFSTVSPNTPAAPTPRPTPPAADPSKAIDALKVSEEFGNNKLAAETKYKRMGAFTLTGKFFGFTDVMDVGYNSTPVILLDEDTNWEHPSVAVQGLDRSFLETLNKGGKVTVKVRFRMISEMMEMPVFMVVR